MSFHGVHSDSQGLQVFPTDALEVAPGTTGPSAQPATPQTQRRGLLRAVWSFPVVMAMFLIVLATFTVRSRFNDPDLWFHLKTGEIIWNTHSIPRVDSFSYTVNGHSRTPQEWLSEVTMYGAWKLGGYTGLMFWLSASTCLLILAVYILSSLYSGNVKVAFLGGVIAWLFSTVGLAIRPHMIGYLLLVCELLIVYLGRTRNWRWFLALPPLFGLWINFHSSFVFGLVVLAIFVFCSFLEIRWGLLISQRWERKQRITLAAALALSIASLFTNPVGWKQVTYPVAVMGSLPISLHNVSEWLPPSFESIRGLALLFIAGLILLVPVLRRIELHLDELLLVALGFGIAVRHDRMVFVFGILAAPVLCRLLAGAWPRYEPGRDRVLPNFVALAVLLPMTVLAFPTRRSLEEQVQEGNPAKAVEFLKHTGLSGRMFNEYVYGGYLIWAAPERKVFIDGRGDVFEWAGIFADYCKLMNLSEDPRKILDKYHIDFCLVSRDEPVTRVLPFVPGWRRIYSDKTSVIFAKSGASVQ